MITFPERLKKLRQDKGITQKALAEAIGVSKYTVCFWERGQRNPENPALKKLSEYFNVSIPYLLGETFEKIDSSEEAIWLESEDTLKLMIEKIARLSDDSKLMINEMINKFYIADQASGKLGNECEITIFVKDASV